MKQYLEYIKENFKCEMRNDCFYISVRDEIITIKDDKWHIEKFRKYDRKNIFNLKVEENWSVLILILNLFNKGYTKEEIYLEKSFLVGHDYKYLDVAIYNKRKPFAFIEVKKCNEISKFTTIKDINKQQANTNPKQLFSYIWQQQWVSVASYYTFDPKTKKHEFFNVFIDDSIKRSNSVDELFEFWNKIWDNSNILSWDKFNVKLVPLKYADLKEISENDVKTIFYQFLTILRLNSVSDHSNAFDKLINILMVKVYDEINNKGDDKNATEIIINGRKVKGLQFQYIDNLDNDVSFLKRLNNLYKTCMKDYMNKNIIDYTDAEIDEILNKSSDSKIREVIDNLRLKKNNAFSFIEVFDDKTFKENAIILKEIVKLLQNWKFKYPNKDQYLGDFFERLLNTTWKQEAGQFFTPMPIVDFMINSLPIKEKIDNYIIKNSQEFIPKMIDYACGSGHFLVSYMDRVQKIIENYETNKNKYKQQIGSYKSDPFSWAEKNVVGIEKDYRLAKTTKTATYLNGDGWAKIINGDGINKFSCYEYRTCMLSSNDTILEEFDFVVANPPFSIHGFMKNIKINGVTDKDFSLLKNMSYQANEIEILFVERAWQLLKKDGIAAIILPRSILFNSNYSQMRTFLLKNFKIECICEFGEKTFGFTPTNPVILFLRKKVMENTNYDVLLLASPLFFKEKSSNEWNFLGYKFSNSKNKIGIVLLDSYQNLSLNYAPIVHRFLLNGSHDNFLDEVKKYKYFSVQKLSNILCENENGEKNLIFTHFKNQRTGFVTLSQLRNDVDFKINPELSELSIDNCPELFDNKHQLDKTKLDSLPYIEIGDIKNGNILKRNKKMLSGSRIICKGDLVIGSVCPSKNNIAISDNIYKCRSAIIVIRSQNKAFLTKLYNYLRKNENNVWWDIWTTLIGFKITYGKISDHNIQNVLLFEKAKLV